MCVCVCVCVCVCGFGVCVFVCVCLVVCVCGGSVTTITRNCVRRFSPNWVKVVGEGSDHLQLINFWPSFAPRKGVCSAAKILVLS